MKIRVKSRNRLLEGRGALGCRGHSLVEFIALGVIMVPLFLSIPLLGKYLDVKHKNIEASRYVVWERAVWSDESGSWNDGSNEKHKSDAQIRTEIEHRIFGHPVYPILNTKGSGTSENALWQTEKGDRLLVSDQIRTGGEVSGQLRGLELELKEDQPPVSAPLVDQVAYKGVPLVGGVLQSVAGAVNKIGEVLGCKLPGIGVEHGMNLGADNYAKAKVDTPVNNYTIVGGEYTMSSTAALLTNAWAASEEEVFAERVDAAVLNDPVGCITFAGANSFGRISLQRGNTPLFGEGLNSHPVKVAVDSKVLLPEYRKRR